jgi:hypothetical protein
MEALGFSSRHFIGELMVNPDAEVPADVLIDSPVPFLYPHLDVRFPGSKFILTTRDKEKWLESMHWMFTHGKVIWNWPRSTQEYHRKFYHTTKFNRKILSKHFDEYHAAAIQYFKSRPGDLHILNIDKGIHMSDLCDFLKIPRQELTFPKSNERQYASLKERIWYNFPRVFNPY